MNEEPDQSRKNRNKNDASEDRAENTLILQDGENCVLVRCVAEKEKSKGIKQNLWILNLNPISGFDRL